MHHQATTTADHLDVQLTSTHNNKITHRQYSSSSNFASFSMTEAPVPVNSSYTTIIQYCIAEQGPVLVFCTFSNGIMCRIILLLLLVVPEERREIRHRTFHLISQLQTDSPLAFKNVASPFTEPMLIIIIIIMMTLHTTLTKTDTLQCSFSFAIQSTYIHTCKGVLFQLRL